MTDSDIYWMQQAIRLAEQAGALGEVPVGAVVVYNNQLVGSGFNQREMAQDPLLHAELIAIRAASQSLKRWRLSGCTLYVTLEPCPMCAGALVNARVDTVVFGARDPRAGAVTTQFGIGLSTALNHRFSLREGILGPTCGELLTQFFKRRRKARPSAG